MMMMRSGEKPDLKTAFNGALADPATFQKRVHLLWIGVGTNEPERMKAGLRTCTPRSTTGRSNMCSTSHPVPITNGKPGAAT